MSVPPSSRPRLSGAAACSAAGVLLAVTTAAQAVAAQPAAADTPSEFTIKDPRITESSGLAASPTHRGVYWTHNDSDDGPYVYAVDSRTGKTVATVTLRGVNPRDVEAVSVGPDGRVYVGDIGDNFGGRWPEVWIRSFPEPKKLQDHTVNPRTYTVRYADGPRDAESLMVHPRTGRVYLASKRREGNGALYEGPRQLSTSGVNTFHRMRSIDSLTTDGAFSPDGTRLMLRGYLGGTVYDWRNGKPKSLGSVPVPLQGQGESVTFTPDGKTLMLGSEGARSTVQPVDLSGRQLPDTVRNSPSQGGGSGDSAGSDNGGASDNADQDDGESSPLVKLGITLVLAFALWAGVKRLFTRRRDD